MNSFLIYTKERFPIGTYLLLTLGFALTGHLASSAFDWGVIVAVTTALLLFFFELRLMDERKDVVKDRIVNPTRPLARGLIPVATADRWILSLSVLMIAYALFLSLAFTLESGITYALITGYLWLMYREFFIGERLAEYPLTYAVTHQAILLPIGILGALATDGRISDQAILLAGMMTASFFSYEICRKLDPNSHTLNKTYLQYHGAFRTVAVVAGLNTLAFVCAREAGVLAIALPFQILLWISLAVPLLRPEKFALTELAATLGLVAHLWAYPILAFYHHWSTQ